MRLIALLLALLALTVVLPSQVSLKSTPAQADIRNDPRTR
jgi:hypothetical protein